MSYNALDFGTSANNDGETLFAAFTKVDAMLAELYVSDGEITHAVTDVASAATCDIGAAATDRVRITGTTTITSFGTSASKLRFVHFAGALTLTHNATSLILIGGANIVTVAGDVCIMSSDGSGNWRMLSFNRGASLSTGDFAGPASSTDNAIVRFDGTTGKTGQNSIISIDDSGVLAPVTTDTGALGSATLMWSDLFLASGAVVNWNNSDVTLTHAANTLTFAGASSGYQVDALIAPSSNDGAPLGSTSLMWSDLFLALGGVINFNNGDVTLTHAANTLTFGGATSGYQFDALAAPSVSDGAALGSTTLMWADLFLASGAVVNFNNGDVTLTHSANTLALAGGTLTTEALTASALVTSSVAGNAGRFLNTADSASVQVVRLEGDRATMADSDEAYVSLMLSDDGGTQTEFARQTWIATDVNAATSVDGALAWSVAVAGSLTAKLRLEGSALTPAASDGTALGTTALQWADVFLAEGGVINWDNGDVTITQTNNVLSFAGASTRYEFDANLTPAASDGAALGTTALMFSDLFLASGAVINFDNGDVTLTHAANGLTFAGVSSGYSFDDTITVTDATNPLRLVNNTDGASVQVARLDGDRATMAADDEGYISLMLSDSGGTQTEFARLTWVGTTVTDLSEAGRLDFSVMTGGTLAKELQLTGSGLNPSTSDGLALGTTALMWADLFLASGAVVNFDNGDVTFTHSANTLTMAGGTLVLPDSGLQMGASNPFSDSAGTLTLQNVDAIDATTETTIEAAIDTLANLTSIQGRTVTLADANLDVLFGWDDSAAAYKNFALADLLTEGAPAAGDFLVIYGAEGDMRKVNWSSLPGAGAGISNVVEDTTPELGGDLESNNNDIKMEQFSADAVSADIYFQKSRHAAIGSHTVVVADDDLGKIIFQGSDGTNFESAAQIRGEVDGTPGNDDMPGRIVFSTTADGSNSLTDRLILDAAGILKPNANDGVALGTGALSYADLFLASGAVINFNNGNYTVTHSAGVLTTNGALSIGTSNALTCGTVELGAASDTTLARSAAGVVTVEGTVLLKGGVHSVWIPAHAMISRTTNGSSTGTLEMTTNKNMFKTLDFDTTTQEFAQFFIQMPKSWDEGTVTFNPVWSHASTVTNFGVVFGLAGVAISNDDAGDVAFGTAQTSTDTGGTTNDIYMGPTSAAITIAGTPAESDYVMFQLDRTVSDGGDTMAVDARLHGIILNYTVAAANDA